MALGKSLGEINPAFLSDEDRYKKIYIEDIPIMMADDGSICCIPKEDEVFSMCLAGNSGCGKCLDEETEIFTNEGIKKIKDVNIWEEVITLNENNQTEANKIINKEKVISNKNVKIITYSGEEIICSKEHNFLIIDRNMIISKKKAEDIDIQREFLLKLDRIPIFNKSIKFPYKLDWEMGFLIGIYLSEGCLVKSNGSERFNRVDISNIDWTIKKMVDYICKSKCLSSRIGKKTININGSKFAEIIEKNFSFSSENKQIPSWVYSTNKKFISGIISGYLNGDGNINKQECSFTSKSEKLAKGIQMLLLCIGVNSRTRIIRKRYKNKYLEYWMGKINNPIRLREVINLFIESKHNSLKKRKNGMYYFIPYLDKNVDKEIFIKGIYGLNGKQYYPKKKSIFFKNLINSKFYFENGTFSKVLNLMADGKRRNIHDIYKELDITMNAVVNCIRNLKKGGILEMKRVNINKIKNFRKKILYSIIKIPKRRSEKLDKIIYFLRKNGESRASEISMKTGICYGTVSGYLNMPFFKRNLKETVHYNYTRDCCYFLNKKNFLKSGYKQKIENSSIKNRLEKLKKCDFFAVKIKNIKKLNREINMYHLEIENNHNFMLANSILSSNSLLLNRIHSYLRYSWNCNVAIMNDWNDETFTWNDEMKYHKFHDFNRTFLAEEPYPSNIIYVFPNTSTLQYTTNMDALKHHRRKYIKIVLPFSEIIDNLQFYLSGICPDFKLKNAAIYVERIKEELRDCKTPTQVRKVLENSLPQDKNFRDMNTKISTAFEALFKEEILDITNPECHAYLKTYLGEETDKPKDKDKFFLSNPFSVIMKSGAIPSLITSDLNNKPYKSAFFAHYINSVFQNNEKDFPNQKTFLIFDELRKICERDSEPAAKALGEVSARGRMKNVGMVFATQFYNKIPPIVKGAKLNYLVVFKHGDENNITREISTDFGLNKDIRKKIKKLKVYECIAMTQNKFVFYRDGEKWESSEPVIGRIFFPLANSKKAGEKWLAK